MGGRGAISSGGGTGDGFSGGADFFGDIVEFDGDLTYGNNDPFVTGSARTTIEAWERKRYERKVEYAIASDVNGNLTSEVRGGKGSVRTPAFYDDVGIFTHNHPREGGGLGGTFSEADLNGWTRGKGVTLRATAKEGTYSISKSTRFDKNGFLSYYKSANNKREKERKQRFNDIVNRYSSGKITYAQAMLENQKSFNTYVVALHSDLIAGQNKYGYVYALENTHGVKFMGGK